MAMLPRLRNSITTRTAAVVVVLLLAATAATAGVAMKGRVGPERDLLVSGQKLNPAGELVRLGNHPTGGALTRDGRFYWTLSTGRGINDIRIVSVRTGKVVHRVLMPGLSGGIAMDPTRNRAYVSGVAESEREDQRVPDDIPGQEGDVVHVFSYQEDNGQPRRRGVIEVPPPPGTLPPQNFPPTNTSPVSWPSRLAISANGERLLVPLNLADRAAVVDVDSRDVRYVATGSYPYGAAILPDGETGLVSNQEGNLPGDGDPEGTSTVSVIDLDSATKVKDIPVGSAHASPEAIALDPKADRAYVALANQDQVVVLDTSGQPGDFEVERTLSTARAAGDGTSPVDVEVTPDGRYLLAAEAGADELAVFRLPGTERRRDTEIERRAARVLDHEAKAAAARHAPRPGKREEAEDEEEEAEAREPGVRARRQDYELVGRIPVADYPTDVDVAQAEGRNCRPRRNDGRTCTTLVWTAAKGLGVGPNPRGPDPYEINDNNALSQNYLPTIVRGTAGLLGFPTEQRIRALTPVAGRQLRPANAQRPPENTPLRPNGPIKHVFYIVKENRTYDQVLGDVKEGDGDPGLAVFGRRVTPNHHALAKRFPLLDHVYANSEASIDGHFWTSAAKVSDYVNQNWHPNYGGRKRPYDFGVYSVTWPQNDFIFDQLERQNISYFNYGEAIAGVVPLNDKDRNAADTAEVAAKFAKSDLGPPEGCFPNDAFIVMNAITQNPVTDPSPVPGDPVNTESRFDCFRARFLAQELGGTVPAFNYIVLPQDHTEGATPGKLTPRAQVARNDHALGQVVDLISKSSVWEQSAIFVIEDDSQDGADHVDAHRIPAFVISPYAKRGKVVHTRYDFLSVIRSMELILGMEPLGLFDQLATPMYDAFTPEPDNDEAYDLIDYRYDPRERNPDTAANRRMSRGLNLRNIDSVPQRVLDRQIWKTVYGPNAEPPPPGPNNDPGG